MTGNTQNQDKAITAEAQHEAAQPSDAKAEAKVGDELSEYELEAVAGGRIRATDKDGLVKS